jgi:hypothetical protein
MYAVSTADEKMPAFLLSHEEALNGDAQAS